MTGLTGGDVGGAGTKGVDVATEATVVDATGGYVTTEVIAKFVACL